MKRQIRILPATLDHARVVGDYLTAARLDEARYLGIDPRQAIRDQILDSYQSWTGTVDHHVGAIWGIKVPTLLGAEAYPWIVTTPIVEDNVRNFMLYSREFIKHWSETYPTLRAFCHIQNDKSARWLEWLGFKEADGIPGFRQFTIGATQWLS